MIARIAGLTLVLTLLPASAAMARTGGSDAPCSAGLRFATGPVVNGHSRQPTPAEFEARKRVLAEWREIAARSCAAARAGAGASLPGAPQEPPPDRR